MREVLKFNFNTLNLILNKGTIELDFRAITVRLTMNDNSILSLHFGRFRYF